MRVGRLATALLLGSLGLAWAQGPARTYVELILDASGSMWKQLADGEYRIVAAKDVLSSFVSGLPADDALDVGLRVYGSRLGALDDGACEDSALFVPLAGIDREALLSTVRDTEAQGATPIAYSLREAADDFPDEGRKVVVLVTDGEESCGGDVRATLEELRARGVEIELKIVGFDLDERAVQSFEGLGTFENARSAAELAAALGRAVEVEAPQAFGVTVTVTRDGAPAEDGVRVRFLDAVSGEAFDLARTEAGTLAAELPAGSYDAEVEDAFSDAPLVVGGLSVTPEGGNAFAFELAQEVEVALVVSPADPVTGGTVAVEFAGAPAGASSGRDFVTVVPAGAPDDAYLDYRPVAGASGRVEIRVPGEAATLEARYHLALPEGGTRVVGRSEPFVSVAATATLDVPAEVGAGARFEVGWTGPDNDRDYVTVVAADAPEGAYASYAYTRDGTPLALTAPIEPGAYEVRYQSDVTSGVLARAAVTVTAAEYGLEAPAEVVAGAAFAVTWTGPGNERDYVTIVPAGAAAGTYLDYAYTRDGNPLTLDAPVEPGAYELRYSTEGGSPDPILASTPITVVGGSYGLEGPAEVAAGERFEVTWSGPGNASDYVTIVPAGAPEGAYLSYAYTRDGNPVTLTAPNEPGAYELRYSTEAASPNPTLTSVPIAVK